MSTDRPRPMDLDLDVAILLGESSRTPQQLRRILDETPARISGSLKRLMAAGRVVKVLSIGPRGSKRPTYCLTSKAPS